jgi:hypothetical protein
MYIITKILYYLNGLTLRFHCGHMSLGCILIDASKTSISTVCERIRINQISFKHSFAILWGLTPGSQWNEIQLAAPRGSCRLLSAKSCDDVLKILDSLILSMFESKKLNVQKQFFIAVSLLV